MRKESLGFRLTVDNPNATIDRVDTAAGFINVPFRQGWPYAGVSEKSKGAIN
jgi:hypothetical protein